MLLLGDGYSLRHISAGWGCARHQLNELPKKCPQLGVSCWSDRLPGSWPGSEPVFLAVAAFFPTEGPWMLAEYLMFTQYSWIPNRIKNEAFKRSVPAMLALATAHGKRLMFPNSSSGVSAILRNMGVAELTGLKMLMTPEDV